MVERHTIAWYTSIVAAVAATLMTLLQVFEHLQKNPSRRARKYMIRVVLMVPIYSIESWLSLRFYEHRELFGVLRELYEAYVVYSFFLFLEVFLEGSEHICDLYDMKEKPQPHMIPFCCLSPWKSGQVFFFRAKYGTLQYVYLRTTTSLISLVLISLGKYDEGSFDYTGPYVYIVLLNNFSQIWAIYCLALFYMAFKNDLAPMKPIPKFMSIKLIVFFTF